MNAARRRNGECPNGNGSAGLRDEVSAELIGHAHGAAAPPGVSRRACVTKVMLVPATGMGTWSQGGRLSATGRWRSPIDIQEPRRRSMALCAYLRVSLPWAKMANGGGACGPSS